MAVTINASTSSGVITTADNSGALQLQTNNGTTAMTIDTSQNVGIGTTSPAAILHTVKTSAGAATVGAFLQNSDNTTSTEVRLAFAANTNALFSDRYGWIGYVNGGGTNSGSLTFATTPGGQAAAERMRIDSSGNVLVGTTTVRAKISNDFNGSTTNGIALNDTASASGTAFVGFYNNGPLIGSITRVGATSAVAYNTTSDERLKSNIVNSNSVLDKLMQVQVRQYDWTEGSMHQEYGFIAQELEPVLSGIVTKGKTDDDMWQLDYSRLTPHLVKAIQEQQTIINELKSRIEALEGAK